MEKNTKSKTHMEIFLEKYPVDRILENPLKATEAYGYLECIEQFLPSESWVDTYKGLIILALVGIADERFGSHE